MTGIGGAYSKIERTAGANAILNPTPSAGCRDRSLVARRSARASGADGQVKLTMPVNASIILRAARYSGKIARSSKLLTKVASLRHCLGGSNPGPGRVAFQQKARLAHGE